MHFSVHVVGSHKGRTFFDEDLSYILGEGSEVGIRSPD